MIITDGPRQSPKSFFTDEPLDKLDLDGLDKAFRHALRDDGTPNVTIPPDAAVCMDFSLIEGIFRRVSELEVARRISGMFGALMREELDAALDWTDRNRHVPASNWEETVI